MFPDTSSAHGNQRGGRHQFWEICRLGDISKADQTVRRKHHLGGERSAKPTDHATGDRASRGTALLACDQGRFSLD